MDINRSGKTIICHSLWYLTKVIDKESKTRVKETRIQVILLKASQDGGGDLKFIIFILKNQDSFQRLLYTSFLRSSLVLLNKVWSSTFSVYRFSCWGNANVAWELQKSKECYKTNKSIFLKSTVNYKCRNKQKRWGYIRLCKATYSLDAVSVQCFNTYQYHRLLSLIWPGRKKQMGEFPRLHWHKLVTVPPYWVRWQPAEFN